MGIPNMISTRNFTNPRHAKIWDGHHNAGGHPKGGKFIIEMGTTKMGFNFNQADTWFNHKFSCSINLFSTTFLFMFELRL